ncbi:MAG: exodeoxyribonuclease VII small subunit [Terrimicrobiaceae bacterium]|nr:exodeoxyribonuclease VII small subunit [Terrimicrobiaceae bacterium]
MAQKPANPTLESALERIHAIVSEMEEGNLPLETLITRYEEGVGLVKFCQERLEAAEKRIQIITSDAKGKSSLEPFDPEESDG